MFKFYMYVISRLQFSVSFFFFFFNKIKQKRTRDFNIRSKMSERTQLFEKRDSSPENFNYKILFCKKHFSFFFSIGLLYKRKLCKSRKRARAASNKCCDVTSAQKIIINYFSVHIHIYLINYTYKFSLNRSRCCFVGLKRSNFPR